MLFATAVAFLLAISSPHGSDAGAASSASGIGIGKFDRKLKGADSVTHKRRVTNEFQSNRKLAIIQGSTDDVAVRSERRERSISMGEMSRAERVRWNKRVRSILGDAYRPFTTPLNQTQQHGLCVRLSQQPYAAATATTNLPSTLL